MSPRETVACGSNGNERLEVHHPIKHISTMIVMDHIPYDCLFKSPTILWPSTIGYDHRPSNFQWKTSSSPILRTGSRVAVGCSGASWLLNIPRVTTVLWAMGAVVATLFGKCGEITIVPSRYHSIASKRARVGNGHHIQEVRKNESLKNGHHTWCQLKLVTLSCKLCNNKFNKQCTNSLPCDSTVDSVIVLWYHWCSTNN